MEKKTKFILLGLGVVALGTGAYLFYRHKNKSKNATSNLTDALTTSRSTYLPETTASSSLISTSAESSFPLKKGSKGSLVKSLQEALIKTYGSSILPKYGADGMYGSETEAALRSKNLPTVVDSETYSKIIISSGGSTSSLSSGSTSSEGISSNLHLAIKNSNLNQAVDSLRKIGDVSEYSAVNSIFKQTRVGAVRKTIVTALLDKFYLTDDKKDLNEEFYRIGLKYDGSKWSLAGVLMGVSDGLITTNVTNVWNESGETIEVPKGTILGEYLDANGLVTEFETMDGKRLFVSTKDIRYTS